MVKPPETRRPPEAMAAADLATAVKARDGRCVLTGQKEITEAAHLIPRHEKLWFQHETMQDYSNNPARGQECIDDVTNAITLRTDVHQLFDRKYFVFVPKLGKWVAHFLKRTSLPGPYNHNREMPGGPDVSTQYLLARVAWAILPLSNAFLATSNSRTVQVRVRGNNTKDEVVTIPGVDI